MKSFNQSIFLGHVGQDPEIITTVNGKKKASLSIATNEVYTDKNNEKVTVTDWHYLEAWGKLAEIIEKFVKKGAAVQAVGKHKTDSYDDKDGEKRYKSYFLLSSINLLDSKFVESAEVKSSEETGSDDLPF